jgi:hypothetical protein
VGNPDPEVTYSGRVHNVALYDSARPYFQITIFHSLCELEKVYETAEFIVRYYIGWSNNMHCVVLLSQDAFRQR